VAIAHFDLGGGDWSVRNENSSVLVGPDSGARVPGGIYTDLQRANKLGKEDIYYRFNDLNFGWISEQNWIYEKTFEVPHEFNSKERVVLTLEGVDTVADVILNGKHLATVDNMFVR